MFLNYLKIALRNLLRQKGHSFINIAGLSIGIAAAILIFVYARNELLYDQFHENAEETYLVYKQRSTALGTRILYDTWVPLLPQLKSDYPAIVEGARLFDRDRWVQYEGQKFQENIAYADPEIFDVFSFPLIRGDAATALNDQNSIVVSQDIATKYFGSADPIGKTITVNYQQEYTVRGVLAEIPENSSIQFDFLAPFESAISPDDERRNNNWNGSFLFTYVLLDKNASQSELEGQFPRLVDKIWGEDGPNGTKRHQLKLRPLPDYYNEQTNARQYAFILLAIAGAILLIASINFMNLTTARSLDRAREIGMRKVLGAERLQLIRQFLGESLVMSLIALVLGVIMAELLLPVFNNLYNLQLSLNYFGNIGALSGLLALAISVGVLAGSYPALVLSGFKPVESLKGKLKHKPSGVRLRNVLVTAQFVLSSILIMGTIIIWQQIQYMKNHSLNFKKENIIVVPTNVADFENREEAGERIKTLKHELRQVAGITSVASSSSVPGQYQGWNTFVWPEDWESEEPLRMRVAVVDETYFQTYQIPFLEGRNFSTEFETDSEALIINETAMKAMGWDTAIGKKTGRGERQFTIVGVVKDFHWESLQNEIGPVIHRFRTTESSAHDYISIGVNTADVSGIISLLREKWSVLDPQRTFDYFFVDDRYNSLYETEERMATVTGYFSALAIIIACLGLFALASFTVMQRTKEIGIRKSLGASAGNIIVLISKSFLGLVFIASIIAVPAAIYLMNQWLADFPYRVAIGWEVFVGTVAVSLLIALITIGYNTIKAARANPIDALRYE